MFTRLRVVEKEDHGLVVHPGLHEAALQILVPFYRPVILRDLDLCVNIVSHKSQQKQKRNKLQSSVFSSPFASILQS